MQTAKALLELQQVELGILRDRKALEEIPEVPLIQEVRTKQKELARRTTKIVGLLKDQHLESQDNEGRRATLTRYVEEVNYDNAHSTDFRKIQNNNAELDRLAKRLEKVDFNQRAVHAEIKRLEGVLVQAKSIKTALEAREAELVETFKQKATALKEDLSALTARREALREQIPAELLERYDRSCAAHNHVGVGRLEETTCTGCGVELQPSQVATLRVGETITACPVCGRILVTRL